MVRLQDFIIIVMVFTMVMTGMYLFLFNFTNTDVVDYDMTINKSFSKFYDKLNESYKNSSILARDLETKTEGQEGALTGVSTLIFIPGYISEALGMMFRSLSLTTSVVTETGKVLGIPEWFWGGIITILIIVLVFLVISAIRGYKI